MTLQGIKLLQIGPSSGTFLNTFLKISLSFALGYEIKVAWTDDRAREFIELT